MLDNAKCMMDILNRKEGYGEPRVGVEFFKLVVIYLLMHFPKKLHIPIF